MADKKEAAPADAPEEEEGGEKKSGNLGLVIGIIAAIVVIQGGLAYLLVPKPVDEAAIAIKEREDSIKAAAEAATSVGTFTAPIEAVVNIAGTDGERFLKAIIVLEFEENKKGTFGPELLNRSPKFKDLMINHLSALTLAEITEPGAQDKIRKNLLRQINSTLPNTLGEVEEVRFNTFIIQ